MFHKQNVKLLMRLGILGGILCSLFVTLRWTDAQNLAASIPERHSQERVSVPVTALQLDLVDGVVPVYLDCQETVMIAPSTLDNIPCNIKNNSGKSIRAIVLAESVTIENNGTKSSDLGYVTVDSFIHPDFHIESNKDGLDKNAEPQVPSVSETYDGNIIRVQVGIDYVEFSDKQTLGPNKKGQRILLGMRDGAAKYKKWLSREYEMEGRSVVALSRLIQNPPSRADLDIENASQQQGAVIYQNWLRRINQTKGIEEVRKTFNSAVDH